MASSNAALTADGLEIPTAFANSATSATSATPEAPATPHTTRPTPRPMYVSQTAAMRSTLAQTPCHRVDERANLQDILHSYDLIASQLQALMGEDGFFPGFTPEQKKWYMDATLYNMFFAPRTQHKYNYPYPSSPQQNPGTGNDPDSIPEPDNAVQASHESSPPTESKDLDVEPPSDTSLARQSFDNENGVDLAESTRLSSQLSSQTPLQHSNTSEEADPAPDGTATECPQPEVLPGYTSKPSDYVVEEASENTKHNKASSSHLMNPSTLHKQQLSGANRAHQQDFGGAIQLPSTRNPSQVPKFHRHSISKDNTNLQMQTGPSRNSQQATVRHSNTHLMINRQNYRETLDISAKPEQYPSKISPPLKKRSLAHASFLPSTMGQPQHIQNHGYFPPTPPMSYQGSQSQYGNHFYGSPDFGGNLYVQNPGYEFAHTMQPLSQPQISGQQNSLLSNSNIGGQYVSHPFPETGQFDISTTVVADHYQQQPKHNVSVSDSATQLPPSNPNFYMGIPLETPFSSNPIIHGQAVFRSTSAQHPPTELSSTYGHSHPHSDPLVGTPDQFQQKLNGYAGFDPSHQQQVQVQYDAQLSRTNSAPLGYVLPNDQTYSDHGHKNQGSGPQGGYPMIREDGTMGYVVKRRLLQPEHQARVESIERKRDITEFIEEDFLTQGAPKRRGPLIDLTGEEQPFAIPRYS